MRAIVFVIAVWLTAASPAIGAEPPTVKQAKAYALERLGRHEYACLDAIFTRESHWNTKAYNKRSGAYGIPQAVPGSKMASAGKDWRTNPITQTKWGIRYVQRKYGSACAAWAHTRQYGWY